MDRMADLDKLKPNEEPKKEPKEIPEERNHVMETGVVQNCKYRKKNSIFLKLNLCKIFLHLFLENCQRSKLCKKVSEKSKTAKDLEETTEKPIVTTTLSYLPRTIDVIRM